MLLQKCAEEETNHHNHYVANIHWFSHLEVMVASCCSHHRAVKPKTHPEPL